MRQPGETARLTYDSTARVAAGDYIQTGTGRTYLIDAVRVQERGKHAGRQHLTCIVMAPDHELEPDAKVWQIRWYRRQRRSRR